MKNTYKNIAILLLLFISFTFHAQNDTDVQAKIKIDKSDTRLDIYAYVENRTDQKIENLNYSLLSLKETTTKNYSQNKQSGSFTLLPNETKLLSKQSFNKGEESSISVNLLIKKGLDQVAIDVVQINDSNKNMNQRSAVQMLSDENKIVKRTTTKHGKFFIVFFNEINKNSKTIFPSEVIISEKICSDNRNTEISVHTNDYLIYSFRAIPKKDYLYAAAQESVKRLKKFYLNGSGGILADKSSY